MNRPWHADLLIAALLGLVCFAATPCLSQTKTDDPAERTTRAKKLLADRKFSHPREITNPYLPLAKLKKDVLEGTEEGAKIRLERTQKPELRKSFKLGDLTVEALAFEDRVLEDGKLIEVAIAYLAQDDRGTVFYLGEDVDEYEDGKLIGHEGSWAVGKDTPVPGVLFPSEPKIGVRWRSEDISAEITETNEIVSLTEKVVTPLGQFENCVKVKVTFPDGVIEYKCFAKGVGIVREASTDGEEMLDRARC